ncbi:RNA polymerase sigma factor [Neolewinella persica]|uniref:RNA polymerase sigma factor n=1 Tax=Neolewinella persica TaxID=70998 RepID=UPI00035C4B62|nr:RNA polymerase sigma factor [Neolewinella persica]
MTNQEFINQINKLENLLFSFALRLTRNRHDAEDLMQETSLRAYHHREKFTMGTNFKSWVSTIMRNTYINRYRKMKSRKHVNQPIEDFSFALESKNAIPNKGEHDMRMKELQRMMAGIGNLYSVPFLMFYRGYEYKEIAAHLNIPIGTVKSRIFLARQRMKLAIGDRYQN